MPRQQSHDDVKMLSQITATFSVALCEKSEASTECQITDTRTMHVVGFTKHLHQLHSEAVTTCFNSFQEIWLLSVTVYIFLFIARKQHVSLRCCSFKPLLVINKAIKANYTFHQRISAKITYVKCANTHFLVSSSCCRKTLVNDSDIKLPYFIHLLSLQRFKTENGHGQHMETETETLKTSTTQAQILLMSFCFFCLFLRRNIKRLV